MRSLSILKHFEPHENFTVPYKKRKALDKLNISDINVNKRQKSKLWMTLSKKKEKKKKKTINTMLNLKTRFVRKRRA